MRLCFSYLGVDGQYNVVDLSTFQEETMDNNDASVQGVSSIGFVGLKAIL